MSSRFIEAKEAARRLELPINQLGVLVARGILDEGHTNAQRKKHFTSAAVSRAGVRMANQKWLAVVRPENWIRLLDHGLTFTVLPPRWSDAAMMIRKGNKIVFYLTRRSAFVGVAEILGKTEVKTVVWPNGVYDSRIPLRPISVLGIEDAIDIRPLIERLGFIRKKEPWEMYLRHALFRLSEEDFSLLYREIQERPSRQLPGPMTVRKT